MRVGAAGEGDEAAERHAMGVEAQLVQPLDLSQGTLWRLVGVPEDVARLNGNPRGTERLQGRRQRRDVESLVPAGERRLVERLHAKEHPRQPCRMEARETLPERGTSLERLEPHLAGKGHPQVTAPELARKRLEPPEGTGVVVHQVEDGREPRTDEASRLARDLVRHQGGVARTPVPQRVGEPRRRAEGARPRAAPRGLQVDRAAEPRVAQEVRTVRQGPFVRRERSCS